MSDARLRMASNPSGEASSGICVKLVDAIGGQWPTPQVRLFASFPLIIKSLSPISLSRSLSTSLTHSLSPYPSLYLSPWQRGHWFPREGDIESFRNKIRSACPIDAVEVQCLSCIMHSGLIVYNVFVRTPVGEVTKDEKIQVGPLPTRLVQVNAIPLLTLF